MANLLDRFQKNVVGTKRLDKDCQPYIMSSGDFELTYGIDTILKSWNVILNTPKGSYDNDPTFGSNLFKYVFDQADKTTMSRIKNEVERSLMDNDSRARIMQLDVNFLTNLKGFNISILVEYKGKKETMKTTITENSSISLLADV